MHIKQTIAAAAVFVSLAFTGAAAFAHEGRVHSDANATVKKEQMPWGIGGEASAARRTVKIAMSDEMRFTPSSIEVKQGDTVRFIITNKGKLMHEMVIGDKKTLDGHAALMAKFPTMEHDEPYMAHVPSGKKETLVWTFNQPGEFDFACLIAGHYQAGMAGKITVAKAGK
jgi:uncharacterized cupredoxin-like copper-binding protein